MNTALSSATRGNLLVVDDTPANLDLLTQLLSEQGYRVRVAPSGRLALRSCQAAPPDLVLLDINMPDMNGYEVCQALKTDPRTQHIPIIFVSAFNTTANKVSAFELGGVDYITKPFEPIEVLARIQNQLRIRHLQQQLTAQNDRLQQEIQRCQAIERQLRESNERWTLTLLGNNDGIWDWNIQTGQTFRSERMLEILGYDDPRVYNTHEAWIDAIHPDDRDQVLATNQAYLSQQIPHYACEYRLRCRDGSYKWVLSRGQAQWDADGTPLRMLGSTQDIHDRKQAELEIRLLLTVTQAINAASGVDSALEVILATVCQTIGWDFGEAWMPNTDASALEFHQGWAAPNCQRSLGLQRQCQDVPACFKANFLKQVWISQQSQWVEDIAHNSTFYANCALTQTLGVKAALGVPIAFNHQVLAVLAFFKTNLVALDPRSLELVNAVAAQLGAMIQRKTAEAALRQANLDLARLATLDGLTQVANRRWFDEYLEQEWKRSIRDQQSIALLLGDVDYFKAYNDHYGHQQGDDCLQQVAQALVQSANRPADLVARYGGEEFAIILPNTSLRGASTVARSIQTKIERLKLLHASSPVSPYLTISLGGVAIVPTPTDEMELFIAAVDRALYAAKEQGRNQLVIRESL